MGQRIDLEPLYMALKLAIGEYWVPYKEATSLFILGQLNQAELSARIDHFFGSDLNKEHLHNQLISAVYGNVTRDLPDHVVASWVSANDKPTIASKPVTGDAAEQRLKMEVMQLPARDRRRLKEIPESDPFDTVADMLVEYHQAKQVRVPDVAPMSAGGMNKTNWEPEVRKRYAQPLAAETGEFPDHETIQSRMEAICFEQGLLGGAADGAAAYLNTAMEFFVKEITAGMLERTRSNNGPNGIVTGAYKRQLEREEDAFARGELQKNANGLFPIEQTTTNKQPALSMADLRLSVELGNPYLGHMPLSAYRVMNEPLEGELYDENGSPLFEMDDSPDTPVDGGVAGVDVAGGALGTAVAAGDDDDGGDGFKGTLFSDGDCVMLDDFDWGWEGGSAADREKLNTLLDDCLAGNE